MTKAIEEAILQLLKDAKEDLPAAQYEDLLENVSDSVNDLIDKIDEDEEQDDDSDDLDDAFTD